MCPKIKYQKKNTPYKSNMEQTKTLLFHYLEKHPHGHGMDMFVTNARGHGMDMLVTYPRGHGMDMFVTNPRGHGMDMFVTNSSGPYEPKIIIIIL